MLGVLRITNLIGAMLYAFLSMVLRLAPVCGVRIPVLDYPCSMESYPRLENVITGL